MGQDQPLQGTGMRQGTPSLRINEPSVQVGSVNKSGYDLN